MLHTSEMVLAVLAPIATAALLIWSSGRPRLMAAADRFRGVVGNFFVSIGLLFSLFAGFLVNDIWIRGQDTALSLERSLEREAGAISTVAILGRAIGSDGDAVRTAAVAYTEAFRSGPQAVNAALEAIVDAALALPADLPGRVIVQTELLEAVRDIIHARADRPRNIAVHDHGLKWVTVVMLGLLTQIGVAVVHIGNGPAMRLAIVLFTMAFTVVLAALAVFEAQTARGATIMLPHPAEARAPPGLPPEGPAALTIR